MFRRALAATLIVLMLTSHFNATLALKVCATGEADALTALKFMEEELEKGKIPSGSITEASFIIPEGFPIEPAKKLWLFAAQLISMGCSDEEIRRAIREANDTLALPAQISYELKDYTIIPKYEEIHVDRNNEGGISVQVPYLAVDNRGNEVDAGSIRYESNGTNLFHILYRYPKKRTYLVRCIDPDAYIFAFIDLGTGEVFNKTARVNIGLFSNMSQGYFTEGFLIAVPGHFEEVREAVGSQVSEFRVLLPAYDPIVVDTSISSTRVGIGDTITITAQIRNPQEIRGSYRILLGVRFSDSDAFEAWASPPGSLYSIVPLYLKAKKPGVYTITIYFAVVEPENLDAVFWNGGKTATYVITVLPEPPKLKIELEAQALAKFANLTVTLLNKGGQEARDVKLFITGDVENKELGVSIVRGSWTESLVVKLLSPIASVNVTVVYHDLEGKRYTNTALTTISTANFVTPEEWRTYVVEVEGYEETKRVFVPGYNGATHVRLYLMASDAIPECLSGLPRGLRFIPISPSGFTLTLENASNVSQITSKDPNVRYMLVDVKPTFLWEKAMREDEVKKLLRIDEDETLEPSWIPSGYEIRLLREEVLSQREVVTVTDDFYEWLKYNNWEDYGYKYEDTGVKKWDLNKATTRLSHGKTMEFIYRPLAYGGGNLFQGLLVKNYAAMDMEYRLEVLSGPIAEIQPDCSIINVPAHGSVPLNLVQLEDARFPVLLSLKYGDRVIASLWVHSTGGKVSEFWSGFWDGVKERAPGIILTTAILIILAVPTGGSSLLAEVKALLASAVIPSLMAIGIASNIREIFEAYSIYTKMDEVAEVFEGYSQRAAYAGYFDSHLFFQVLKSRIREGQGLVVGSTALDLLTDVTIRDIFITF